MRFFTSSAISDIQSKDRSTVHYEYDIVPSAKDIIFFLHGLGGGLSAWDRTREFLKDKGYSTLAIDLRGHGFSGRPKKRDSYSLSHFNEDILAVLAAENIKSVILVGHCFGGVVALNFAAHYPEHVKKLVLANTSYKTPFFASPFEKLYPLRKLMSAVTNVAPKAYIRSYVKYNPNHHERDVEPIGITKSLAHTSPFSYLSISEQLNKFNGYSLLSKIVAPTLIITGDKDHIYPAKLSEEMHTAIHGSQLINIPGSNHPVVTNRPIELAELIYQFIGSPSTN